MGSGDVCPELQYLAFEDAKGSIARMAVVRRTLPRELGRYLVGDPIAAGGMATVHLGRLVGPAGFSRTVAIKRMHRALGERPDLVARFVDEARIASRVRHANVVQTLDVVSIDGELLLVLEYVHGESLARLRKMAARVGEPMPLPILSAIVVGVLRGLHAAHEATTARGTALEIVHRDVSPQNVIVGVDGVPRVLDFGIARAEGREAETIVKDLKGKLAYMAPEQISGETVDRRCDLWATAVMAWETLARERLFKGEDAVATMDAIFRQEVPALAPRGEGVTPDLDALLARALAKGADDRFATAEEMARALEAAVPPATDGEVADWVKRVAKAELANRAALLSAFERDERSAPGSETRIVASDAPALVGASTTMVSAPPKEEEAPKEEDPPTFDGVTLVREAPKDETVEAASRPVLTPMEMVRPFEPPLADDPDNVSATRFHPVEHLRRAVRTPIPVPPAPVPPRPRKKPIARFVAMGFVPGALVATLIVFVSGNRHHSPPPALAAEALPEPVPVPVPVPEASAAPVIVALPPPSVSGARSEPPRHSPRLRRPGAHR